MIRELFLNTRDELKLFLVENSFFSATNIFLDLDNNFVSVEKTYDRSTDKFLLNKYFDKSLVKKFCGFLEENNLHYSVPQKIVNINSFSKGYVLNNSFYFYVSNNDHVLFLLNQDISLEQKLQIMGWPEDDAVAFSNKDPSIYDAFGNKFKEAQINGVLSSSLAYLTFIPEKFDWVNDDYKLKTVAHCMNVQRFVRNNNPYLAQRVEKEFLNLFSKNKNYDSDNFISFFGLNSN